MESALLPPPMMLAQPGPILQQPLPRPIAPQIANILLNPMYGAEAGNDIDNTATGTTSVADLSTGDGNDEGENVLYDRKNLV